jgi:hypothetical protein
MPLALAIHGAAGRRSPAWLPRRAQYAKAADTRRPPLSRDGLGWRTPPSVGDHPLVTHGLEPATETGRAGSQGHEQLIR